jgi:hypothetical protein
MRLPIAAKNSNLAKYASILRTIIQLILSVGAPIPVKKESEPDQALIDAVHAEYCAKLRELFDTHKVSLGGLTESAQLEFL